MGGGPDERRREDIAPKDCQVFVLYVVPLLPRSLGRDGTSPGIDVSDQLEALAGDDVTDDHLKPPGAVRKVFDPMKLWGYSDHVNTALRESMPHASRSRALSKAEVKGVYYPGGRAKWTACLGRLDMWSVGVGIASVAFQLDADEDTSWRDVRSSATSEAVKTEVLNTLRATVASQCGEDGDLITALWTQAMFVVRAKHEVEQDTLAAIAETLTSHGKALELYDDCGEALSLGTEACAVAGPHAGDYGIALGRVVVAQTATWAAAIGMDRDLSVMLDSGASEAQRLSLDQLEDRSVQLLAQYEQVQKFRAGVDLIPLHLGDPDRAMWASVNAVWELNRQLKAMDAKVSAVEHIYGHLSDKMAAKQARFLNLVVLGVTCVSLATFIFSIEEFVRKRFDPLSWLSVGVVAASVFVSLLFYFLVSGLLQRTRVRVPFTGRRGT